VRFEHRLLKARKARDVLGFSTAGDLLIGFEQVKVSYVTAMKKQLFRYSPAEIEILTVRDYESHLKSFQRAGKLNFVEALVLALGFQQLSANKEAFLSAVENVTESRATLSRIRKKLMQAEIDSLFFEREAPSTHTLGELYRELECEVLAD
jgi:hypothetical protein